MTGALTLLTVLSFKEEKNNKKSFKIYYSHVNIPFSKSFQLFCFHVPCHMLHMHLHLCVNGAWSGASPVSTSVVESRLLVSVKIDNVAYPTLL